MDVSETDIQVVLDELAVLVASTRAGSSPKRGPGSLWEWCQQTSSHFFDGQSCGVTHLGVRVLETLSTVFVDHSDVLVPEMIQWLKQQVFPALLKPAEATDIRSELAYLLLDAVLHHVLTKQSPTTTNTTTKRVRKRRQRPQPQEKHT